MKKFALITVLLIAACGFHPVYGVNKHTNIGAEEHLALTTIGNIPEREGQYLRNTLIDRFYRSGRPLDTQYNLAVGNITENIRDLDVTIDSDSTRAQLILRTSIKLTNKKDGAILIERKLRSTASYNIIESEYANRVSEQNARENTLDDIARQIEEQLVLYFKRNQ